MKRILTLFACIITLYSQAFAALKEPQGHDANFSATEAPWMPLESLYQVLPDWEQNQSGNDHDYYFCIATIFKNEAPFLREWIEYHLMMGVDHFYLYNNSSEDDFMTVLQPYIDGEIVTLIDWPNVDEENWGDKKYAWVQSTQKTAMLDAIERSKKATKWLAVIDTDEFMVPIAYDSVVEMLVRYEKYPGIRLRWQTFGTSGVFDIPPGHLLIELLTLKAPPEAHMNSFVKEIVRPTKVKEFKWVPHMFNYLNRLLPYRPSILEARINHYTNRTVNYFYTTKVKNKEKMDNKKLSETEINEAANNFNDIEDRTMERFVPLLKQRMGFE